MKDTTPYRHASATAIHATDRTDQASARVHAHGLHQTQTDARAPPPSRQRTERIKHASTTAIHANGRGGKPPRAARPLKVLPGQPPHCPTAHTDRPLAQKPTRALRRGPTPRNPGKHGGARAPRQIRRAHKMRGSPRNNRWGRARVSWGTPALRGGDGSREGRPPSRVVCRARPTRAARDKSSEQGLNLSGSWQQGHSAAYNTPFLIQVVCRDSSRGVRKL